MFPGRFATYRSLVHTRRSLCPIRRSTMLSFPFTSLPNIPSFLSMHRCRIAIPRLPRCPTSAAVRLPCHRPPPLMCPLPRPRPAREPRRITPTLICAVAFASSPAPGPSRPALRVPGRRLPCFSVSYPYTPLHSTLSLGLCMYFRCPYAVFLYCTYKGLFYRCLVGIFPPPRSVSLLFFSQIDAARHLHTPLWKVLTLPHTSLGACRCRHLRRRLQPRNAKPAHVVRPRIDQARAGWEACTPSPDTRRSWRFRVC